MTKYVLVTSYPGAEPDAPSELSLDDLVAFLRENIATEHYAGDGLHVDALYRRDAPGAVTELRLARTAEARSCCEVTWGYEISGPDGIVARFSVTVRP